MNYFSRSPRCCNIVVSYDPLGYVVVAVNGYPPEYHPVNSDWEMVISRVMCVKCQVKTVDRIQQQIGKGVSHAR